MKAIDESEALHEAARALVRAYDEGAQTELAIGAFDELAGRIARFQAAHVEGFARLVRSRGLAVEALTTADVIPAVPTDAFKVARVSAFSESETPVVLRTSGTTLGARGSHFFRTTATYDAAAWAFAKRTLFAGMQLDGAARVVVVGPREAALADSSLTHMLARFVEATWPEHERAAAAERAFVLDGDIFDLVAFDEIVSEATVAERPLVVCGTSFAFVHFLDALGDDTFALPPGSRVMTTGGFKGKSREVDGAALRAALAASFRVPVADVASEYGMTELSSQFYEGVHAGAAADVFVEPPWARVVPVDPDTLEPVRDGEVGIAKIIDLMNVDSAVAVLTADRVRRVTFVGPDAAPKSGFALLGRAPGAPPRGCSIAIDEMLDR